MTPLAASPRTFPPALVTGGRLALIAGGIWLVAWSFLGIGRQFDFTHTQTGLQRGLEYIASMIPHGKADWRYDKNLLPGIGVPLAETVQMAVAGTAFGAVCALPVSFLAARTNYVPRFVSGAVKGVLNMALAVPTIIYALIAIDAIGLGAPAGAAAIAFASFVSLARLYAEALESVSVGPIEAVRASGGNAAQVFVFGMLPQVFPLYLSTMLYSLAYNIKDSFIVGIVGAGGLGAQLYDSLRLFRMLDAGVVIALLIVLINLVDYLSYRVRLVFS